MSSDLLSNDNNGGEPQEERDRSPRSIFFPLALIAVGVIFFLQQVSDFRLENWWALFILIPAISSFAAAFRLWQRNGYFSFSVYTTFYGGLFPLLVAIIFLLDLDWGDYWPLFVILGGISFMNGGIPVRGPKEEKIPQALIRHRPWSFFIGLSATLLGVTFQLRNLGIIENLPFLPFDNWWGVFILIPALGGLVTAGMLLAGGHSPILALLNLAAAVLVAFVGFVALYNMDWNLINMAFPILLIVVGNGLIVGFKGKSDK
jgi:hypothetical protein